MSNEIGSAYLGQLIALQAMDESRLAKRKAKKPSFLKRMMKKVAN